MTAADFNYIEAGLWFVIALVLAFTAFNKGRVSVSFWVTWIASLAFIAFGVSDLIETQTGAWWQPVELLLLKAGCIICFVVCFYLYKKQCNYSA